MNASLTLAIPSEAPGGLAASISNHFGHCELFTLVNIHEGKIGAVDTVPNVEHGAGGCMEPVQLLADKGVQAVVVGGLGGRPMQALAAAGITVYYADRAELQNVEAAAHGVLAGQFPIMSADQVCKGHGTCH